MDPAEFSKAAWIRYAEPMTMAHTPLLFGMHLMQLQDWLSGQIHMI